jgi:hypothetical protein
MGRTVPSFRIVLTEEKREWKPFRNALDKSERKVFDEMWDIPRLYVSACSNSVQLVPFHPIAMSILFHHYKDLLECEKQIKLMDNNDKNNNNRYPELRNIIDQQLIYKKLSHFGAFPQKSLKDSLYPTTLNE